MLLVVVPACRGDEPISIPRSSIVSTSNQKDLRHVSAAMRDGKYVEEFGYHLGQIGREGMHGASNAFLVDAPTIKDAVSASVGPLLGGRSADVPAPLNMPDPPRGNYWLVVYLGSGYSTPTMFIVDAVSISGRQIRFTYRKPQPGAATKDIVPYYYWVPLGNLSDGAYTVELYDGDVKDVRLMRRVDVRSK